MEAAKCPVLLDYRRNKQEPVSIWDSYSIVQYLLCTANDDNNMISWLPSDINASNDEYFRFLALSQSITSEMHSSFMALRTECPFNCIFAMNNENISSDVELSSECRNDILRVSDIWNECFFSSQSKKWLFGNEVSIADIYYVPMAIRLKQYQHIINNDILLNDPRQEIVNFYINTVLADDDVQQWIQDGIKETDIIQMFDVNLKK